MRGAKGNTWLGELQGQDSDLTAEVSGRCEGPNDSSPMLE